MILPTPTKLTGAQNYPALKLNDAARWYRALQSRQGTSARALEFQVLTASRTGAVKFATWDEIDAEKGLWLPMAFVRVVIRKCPANHRSQLTSPADLLSTQRRSARHVLIAAFSRLQREMHQRTLRSKHPACAV